MRWVVGTADGLLGPDGARWLAGRAVTAVTSDRSAWLALLDGGEVVRLHGDEVDPLGALTDETARCLVPFDGAALVGTANARLARVADGGVQMLASFDGAAGRDGWYTPWGGPPDTRSLSVSGDGQVFANVHVGGILRADDPDSRWTPTIDVDADVHQVLADPLDPAHVVAATALGLAESRDGGDTWKFATDGLHAPYARAVALDGDVLFLSASTGPRGGRAAVYQREPGAASFQKVEGGLPEWFDGNIDSHRIAAGGGTVLIGTEDGRVFLSEDGGGSWREEAAGLDGVSGSAVAASS
jgi:hypothetical protein